MKIGRVQDCHLIIADGRVSHDHAVIRCLGPDEWFVRDLGSKNGTFLNRQRVGSGDVRLSDQDVLAFGDPKAEWIFSSGQACDLLVIPEGQMAGMATTVREGLLALPSEERADATLLHTYGGWMLEVDGQSPLPIADGVTFTAAGVRYRARICEAAQPTFDMPERGPRWNDVVLRLASSQDQEEVEGEFRVGVRRIALPGRVYLYLLLHLARCRQDDAALGVSVSEAGWRYTDEVAQSLGIDTQALNLHAFRVRKDLRKLGFDEPDALLERRLMTKQIRLGIPPERMSLSSL